MIKSGKGTDIPEIKNLRNNSVVMFQTNDLEFSLFFGYLWVWPVNRKKEEMGEEKNETRWKLKNDNK